jgi:His/Glu/Gln/Arg/opine family amino acid ABC transporter permease subunit
VIPRTDPQARAWRQRILRRGLWLALGVLFLTLAGCSRSSARGNYTWAWWTVSPFTETGRGNLSFLLRGLGPTLGISAAAFGISIPLGFFVALFAFVPSRIARGFNRWYVEVVRAVPTLVLILWVYYGLPVSVGLDLNVFTAGMLALALSDSAFEAEIFRGGIQSIARDHLETARSLGMTRTQTLRYVIMPQAIRRILPPLSNQFVYMLKISSLVSMIGFQELTRRARELTTVAYSPLEIFTVLIVEYLAVVMLASAGARYLEKKLREGYEE